MYSRTARPFHGAATGSIRQNLQEVYIIPAKRTNNINIILFKILAIIRNRQTSGPIIGKLRKNAEYNKKMLFL